MESGVNMKVCYMVQSIPDSINGNTDILLVDYILFIQADVDLEPSPNEVRDTTYVSADELKAMFEQPGLKFTPWFKLICNSMLFEWWGHLGTPALDKYKNEQEIRRM